MFSIGHSAEFLMSRASKVQHLFDITFFQGNNDVVLFITGTTGRIIQWNEPAQRILQWSDEDVIGRTCSDIIGGGRDEEISKILAGILRDGKQWEGTLSFHKNNDEYTLVPVAIVPIQDHDGTIALQWSFSCHDELIESEDRFRTEHKRFQALSENLPFGMALIDKHGVFRYINPKFREIFGYTLRDIPNGKNWFRRAYPDPVYRRSVISLWIEDSKGPRPKSPGSRVYSVTCKDGTERIVNFNLLKLENGDRILFCSDITPQKRVKDALRKSEQEFSDLVNTAPVGIYKARLTGEIVFANKALADIYGYSNREELMIQTIRDFIPDATRMESFLTTLQINKIIRDVEDGIVTKSGKKKIVLINARLDEDIITGMLIDITERKTAERQVARLADLHLSILGAIPMAVMGFRDREIIFANNAVESVFGWKPRDLVGQKTRILYRNDTEYEEAGNRVYTALATKKFFVDEICCRHKNGADLLCTLYSSRIGDYLSDRSIVAIIEDITERRQAQEHLRETSEKLQKTLNGVIEAMAVTIETRDPYTSGHQKRVSRLAAAIARALGLSDYYIESVTMAGIIHDIGKLYIPGEILSKPGILSEIEFTLIKSHAQAGHDILKGIDFPWPLATITLQHHERIDGSGYPKGLRGDDILLEARILAVSDVVESMASHRPYRGALGIERALEEITTNRGILYDEKVVDACINLFLKEGFTL